MKYRDPETGEFKELYIKAADTLPVGSMIPYGNATPPTNWLVCDGSAISRTTYADLFAVIGTSYGEGDGSTTFNLPNKKGKVSVGLNTSDTDFNTIGKTGGEKTHQLTIDEMPSHNHTMDSTVNSGTPGYLPLIDRNVGWGPTGYTTNSTGGNQPHNNLQPYQVDQWIIKAFQSVGVVANVAKTKTTSDDDTYSCNYINSALEEHYSTEEHFTGKYWAGGEKIYSRIFELGLLGDETMPSWGFSGDYKFVIKATAYLIHGSAVITLPLLNAGKKIIAYVLSNGVGGIEVCVGRDDIAQYNDWYAHILIEYTKTTD